MNTTLDLQKSWQAVQERDQAFDGRFVFAVRTTGVYCRPSCPARRPKSENVSFFVDPDAAEAAGFRACLRCHPRDEASTAEQLVSRARDLLDASVDESISLTALAESLSVSPGHLQRTFTRLTGVSPRQYAEALRMQKLKAGLRSGDDVAGATYDAGFGSSSRVYEKAGPLLGMTPGRYRRRGRGLSIGWSIVDSPLGLLLVAVTERGVCFVAIGGERKELEQALHDEFPLATLTGTNETAETMVRILADHIEGSAPEPGLPLDVTGSDFQVLVWQALARIPRGKTSSYQEVAASIGRPTAARAVARACATNPVALLVPCHRVVAADGRLAGYRWGVENKRRLLSRERQATASSGLERDLR